MPACGAYPRRAPSATSHRDLDDPLPEGRIARFPSPERDAARLLVVTRATGSIEHARFRDLPEFLEPGSLLVLNDSRVLPARLRGRRRPGGGKVEALWIESIDRIAWRALLHPGHRLRAGQAIAFEGGLTATLRERSVDGAWVLEGAPEEGLGSHLARWGTPPLPPYLHREPLPEDADRYQTVYARSPGSIAAPTAGLHFTTGLLDRLDRRGFEMVRVTLHIGWGTFLSLDRPHPPPPRALSRFRGLRSFPPLRA